MVEIFKKLFKKEKITKKYKNGDIYVGEMKNDKPHGYGTYTWPNGEKYVGAFKNDTKHGHGTWTLKDVKLVGEWKEDKTHGHGTFTSNEIKFIGKFKDGTRVQGTQTWISGEFAGNKYIGDYKDEAMHGQGSHSWADGSKYVGAWKNGTRCGQGIFTWENKDKYIGEWKDDKMCGQGTWTNPGGDKYVGEVKNDVQHGQGTMTWADGDKYVGVWEDGEQCEGTLTSADGKVEKITKTIKRNELAIFEELRLKTPKKVISPASSKEYKLEKLNLLCATNKETEVLSLWKKRENGKLDQVDEFGQPIYAASDSAEPYPKESSLKKYNTNMMVASNKYGWAYLLWKKMKDGSLVQIDYFGKKITKKDEILKLRKDKKGNLFATKSFEKVTEDDDSIELSIKSWLRNEAINHVGLEIRSLKSKAYNYSKEELMEMIEEEESKIIEKQGWKWIRRIAMVTLGIGFLPGI